MTGGGLNGKERRDGGSLLLGWRGVTVGPLAVGSGGHSAHVLGHVGGSEAGGHHGHAVL